MIWGVAGLRPNFFSSGRIFLAELAQESWRDLAAVDNTLSDSVYSYSQPPGAIGSKWRSSVLSFAADSDCIPIVGAVLSLKF